MLLTPDFFGIGGVGSLRLKAKSRKQKALDFQLFAFRSYKNAVFFLMRA
jgi:hypothetical protein